MGLTGQTTSTPTSSNTFETVTLGDTDDINVLILFEDVVDGDFLFEVGVGPVNLVSDATTVQLDFDQVGTLLAEGGLADLSVSEDTNDSGNTFNFSRAAVMAAPPSVWYF